ncbi:MAG: hypothetical protein ACRDB1_05310 [Microcoleaceae cyanobacterium]
MNLVAIFPLGLMINFYLILIDGQILDKLNIHDSSQNDQVANLSAETDNQPSENQTDDNLLDDNLLDDGIYFYGQTTIPDQLLHEYFIFAVKQHKVIGAFYLPKSAFYCFYGINKPAELDITVVDNFNQTTAPYLVDLIKYYAIPEIRENDQRILNTCIDSYQNRIW